MNPMPQLEPMLKQLRLSGILNSLEPRNRQAVEDKLAYTEFLALLIQDEIARREQRKLAMRMRRAGFQSQKTFESFDFSFNPSINRAQALDLATCRFMEEKANILIAGPCGTGKSHLAQALGHSAIRRGYDVAFVSFSKMLQQLQAARGVGGYDRKLQYLATVDLLVIDDFGLKPLSMNQDEDFHDVVAERYEQRATVITSNLDFDEWGEAFQNKLLGAATVDRLRHGAYRVILNGKSYRTPREENSTCVTRG
ncbi:IS21-like element helper ATPase IstB [Desulfolutivibrio sulfoxidireducens]|uniref:IS21-like element helper ATPase IstB n=1 Tax=Desulfolutivibrio sulfoxidireducens TaxID=2773299 RepID=UPI00159DFF00|nr:IS21-like element helper ATPase IstB [Desulfolutivibrio sulfoxidireducens]QLA15725.1 ATP-binding protein [Desulfolutivibrio sulfoxidireducens]QLA15795.1 ATP-binding protein [Desulfolutivibrio sulfoxidireducens]QLA17378.1 ATP-binding protein [Desulfolutivibrio sulfoxidireducens]